LSAPTGDQGVYEPREMCPVPVAGDGVEPMFVLLAHRKVWHGVQGKRSVQPKLSISRDFRWPRYNIFIENVLVLRCCL